MIYKTKGLVLYKSFNTLCKSLFITLCNRLSRVFSLLLNNECCWCQYRYLVFTVYARQKKSFLGFNPYLIRLIF
jgi:hypothetical protein